jgi:hypothetical protein
VFPEPITVKTFCVDADIKVVPATCNFAVGVKVPIPVFPLLSITNGVESGFVESSTNNELSVNEVLLTCSLACGGYIPIPT